MHPHSFLLAFTPALALPRLRETVACMPTSYGLVWSLASSSPVLRLATHQIIVLRRLADNLVDVFGQEIPCLHQVLGCPSDLLEVVCFRGVALGNGTPGVTSRLARFAGRWERDRRADQGPARRPTRGQGLACPADVRMAQIPASVGRQGHGLEGQAYPTDFIAVLVNGRHQTRVWLHGHRRHMRGNARLWPEVQALKASQGFWQVDSRDGTEGGSELLWRHRRAIVEAGMATGWG